MLKKSSWDKRFFTMINKREEEGWHGQKKMFWVEKNRKINKRGGGRGRSDIYYLLGTRGRYQILP